MLKSGGEELKKSLVLLANTCLRSGKFPPSCKLDHKMLLPKHSRASYNVCKSYRPITLESIIGKVMQRMLKVRLEWQLESMEKLSPTQEAYRKDRTCNNLDFSH